MDCLIHHNSLMRLLFSFFFIMAPVCSFHHICSRILCVCSFHHWAGEELLWLGANVTSGSILNWLLNWFCIYSYEIQDMAMYK